MSEEELRRRSHLSPEELDDVLDALQAKGVIKGRRGSRVQLVF